MKKYIFSFIALTFGMLNAFAQTISIDDVTIKAGETKVVSINLNNSQTNIVSFQMDLTLPDGITIDKAGCSLGSRITDGDQELTIGKQPDGSIRLISASLALNPISDTSGEIVKLSLTASESAKGGTASINNIRLATSNSNRLTPADVSFKVDVSYTLTYKVDGEEYKSFTIVYGTAITPEAEPTKEGYTFSGWSEIPATMPANDVVVTGTFTINQYTVKFLDWDETVISETSQDYHSAIIAPADPVREGYTFTGWDTEVPSVVPAHDVTFTATYSINSYTLTYKVDGEEYKTFTVVYGTAITPEAEPTKEGYTFSGWSEIPETMPARDVEVTGTFTINQYKLTYIVDGEEYKSFEIDYNAAITPISAPIKKGMTFSGWTEIPETMPAHDVTVTGTFSWTEETIDYLIYQVTDTLNNYASVIGYDKVDGKAEILSGVEIGGYTYTVNRIEKDAFAGCTGLTSITIPETIISIGSAAFEDCTSLQEIYCNAEQTPEVKLDAFDSVDVRTVMLVVPDNSVEEYKAHPVWGLFWIETPTGIVSLLGETEEGAIYDLQGRKLTALQNGINILRYSDGTARKVLLK